MKTNDKEQIKKELFFKHTSDDWLFKIIFIAFVVAIALIVVIGTLWFKYNV